MIDFLLTNITDFSSQLDSVSDSRIRERHEAIVRFFDSNGPLSKVIDGYCMRPLQVEMAQAIAETIEKGEMLVAEAGTGTGKTFAYLLPALLWGGKVIISTGTKNLQDQLFLKDMPVIRQVLDIPVIVKLLKGRSNYLCRHRLARTMETGRLASRTDVKYLRLIDRFDKVTDTGDKAELAEVPETAAIWNMVTSTKENCLGNECAYYAECFVMKARQQAKKADVVVVNHHLFFADIVLKDSGVAELLPDVNTVIFDEAHQLPDTARLSFGEFLSTARILEFCKETLVECRAHARDGADWSQLISGLEKAARDLRLVFGEENIRLAVSQIPEKTALFESIAVLVSEINQLTDALNGQKERSEELMLCYEQSVRLSEQFLGWLDEARGEKTAEHILWTEVFGSWLRLHKTPLSISGIFPDQREKGVEQSWIFTSATLALRENFHYFLSQLGLDSARSQSWPSPFNYGKQGLLYVPDNMPLPHMPAFTDAVVDAILPLIEAAGGKTFVLCTTLKAVDRIAERLKEEFLLRDWSFPLLVQGESSRMDLVTRFRNAGNAVLVGSYSFWEGVDVRGDALSLVVIDKLPFAPPDDPVLAARIAALESEGGNGFMDCQLPEAIISLKQGTGRLIRDETDRGVLMICDTRLVSKGYGRRIWQSLPPFSRTRSLDDACAFFSGQE